MGRPSRFSKEMKERAVRLVEENADAHGSEWAAICSVAEKLGCGAETVFVGPSLGLTGPAGVVVPLADHDNHLHARLPLDDG